MRVGDSVYFTAKDVTHGYELWRVYGTPSTFPSVTAVLCTGPTPTNAASVSFTVTFDEPVTGVDASDFAVETSGVTGATITTVLPDSGYADTYTVTVATGTGDGLLSLDLIDNDSIMNAASSPLGGVGADNGNYTAGEAYAIDKTAPTAEIQLLSANPTGADQIQFRVLFNEPLATPLSLGDVALTGTLAAAASVVINGRDVSINKLYNVSLGRMT